MSKRTKKSAPASTEKARKAAIAEIQARVAKADAPTTPATGEPAAKGDAGAKAAAGTPHAGTSPAKGGKGKAAKAPKAKPAKKAKERKAGCLDAAATVLADAKGALGCAAMVEKMLAKGLWSTSGKTPHSTLYAAIIRDIAAKGKASRFRKTERGMFAAA